MRIYFLNKEVADIDFTPKEVTEIFNQINDDKDFVALYKPEADDPYFMCKVSQINYIK